MKKLLIIAIALMTSIAISNAQKVNNFGIRAGVDISKLCGKYNGTNYDTDYKAGFNVGVIDQINFSKTVPLFVETGLMFEQKGGKLSETENGFTETDKANEYYLQVPALLGYNIRVGNGFRIQPFAGLYYGLGVGGKIKTEGESYKEDVFSKDALKRSDFGFRVGAGAVYSNYYLGAGFERSINDIGREDLNLKVRNQMFTISLGYNF